MNKALFLDRDGVVNETVLRFNKIYNKDIDDSPFKKSELKFKEGIKELVEAAREKGYKPIIITNQPSILKGNFTLKEYEEITSKICNFLSIGREYIFECLHKEGYSKECTCRKPKPGLFYMAKGMHNINLGESIMVGDSFSDIKAAKFAGIGLSIYLRRKNSEKQIGNSKNEHKMNLERPIADYTFDNLKKIKDFIKDL